MKIYIPDEVKLVRRLHQQTLNNRSGFNTVFQQLEAFVENISQAYAQQDIATTIEIKNHHPQYLGASPEKIFEANLSKADLQLVIARAYGFADWSIAQSGGNQAFSESFEKAVDLLLSGAKKELLDLLTAQPELLHQRSTYGHNAGLIHYLGSNGIEIWRQVVPSNITEIANMLIELGADKTMKAPIYGISDVKMLIDSSAHPWDAGIGQELSSVFNE
jgi:hypothetical protein